MKNTSQKKDTKEMHGCCNCHPGHGMVMFGILLMVFGLFWERFDFPTALILLGGILTIKGILLALFKKSG
ncbi:Uncharacterised protein [uncultured archaeon]|nr:Uncharacterised protein [uncultured archaeon]